MQFIQYRGSNTEKEGGLKPRDDFTYITAILCHFNYIITSFIIIPAMLTITIIISHILLFPPLVLIMFFNHRVTYSNHAVTEYIFYNWLWWAGCSGCMQTTYDSV